MQNQAQSPISNRAFDSQFLRIDYHNPFRLPDMTVSIDGVRIKHTYKRTAYDHEHSKAVDSLSHLLYALASESLFCEFPMDVRHKEVNFRIGCYSHTLVYELPDGNSFAVLIGRYTYATSEKGIAAEAVVDVTVQWFDLAMDFPIQRDTLSLVRRAGSGYQKFIDEHGVITEYTGRRSHHSAIKLYDKGAELGLSYPLTRLEITIDWAKFSSIIVLMPTILSSSPFALNLCFDEQPFPVKAVLIHARHIFSIRHIAVIVYIQVLFPPNSFVMILKVQIIP